MQSARDHLEWASTVAWNKRPRVERRSVAKNMRTPHECYFAMSQKPVLEPAERALLEALKALGPNGARVDRERLLANAAERSGIVHMELAAALTRLQRRGLLVADVSNRILFPPGGAGYRARRQ